MSGRRKTRSDDERDLAVLDMHERGLTSRQISEEIGVSPPSIRGLISRIWSEYEKSDAPERVDA